MTSTVTPAAGGQPSTNIETTKSQDPLPKLSAEDFKLYNKLAVMMEYYHNHFRQTWTTMYTACENNARPKKLSITQFINMGLQLCHHLTMHHNIEENHIFPVLAQKIPQFSHAKSSTDPQARLMVLQHRQIHAGLEKLEEYLDECKSGQKDFRLTGDGSLKEIMDTFGGVLWEHLNEEVRLLGAENMRQFYSKSEMHALNF